MDIQADKLDLIEWLAGVNDIKVIRQFKNLQKSNEQINLTPAEKQAIGQGLKSIAEGKTHSHESVIESTKEKFPNLF